MTAKSPQSPSKGVDRKAPADFASLLREVTKDGEALPDPTIDPGAAFRRLYDGWVERGGYERGKHRHSVRQIKFWLMDEPVRSLETKIAGRTRMQKDDALNLLRVFLEHWTYDHGTKSYEHHEVTRIERCYGDLLDKIFTDGQSSILLPLRTRKGDSRGASRNLANNDTHTEDGQPRRSADVIASLFAESDAIITVNRAKIIANASPEHAIASFRYLMSKLFDIDRGDNRRRAMIWIVDIGLRQDNNQSVRAIVNLQVLATLFRSVALIEDVSQGLLWKWLCERVIILVGGLTRGEIDGIYADSSLELQSTSQDLRWFQSDRLFLEAVPFRWIGDSDLEVFRRPERELWNSPMITGHLRLEGWDVKHDTDVESDIDLRYFLHDEIKLSSEDREGEGVRCVELPQPGLGWSSGFRLACSAAFGRLGWKSEQVGTVKPDEALAQLRRQHFAVLKLNEFRRLIDLLIDREW